MLYCWIIRKKSSFKIIIILLIHHYDVVKCFGLYWANNTLQFVNSSSTVDTCSLIVVVVTVLVATSLSLYLSSTSPIFVILWWQFRLIRGLYIHPLNVANERSIESRTTQKWPCKRPVAKARTAVLLRKIKRSLVAVKLYMPLVTITYVL